MTYLIKMVGKMEKIGGGAPAGFGGSPKVGKNLLGTLHPDLLGKIIEFSSGELGAVSKFLEKRNSFENLRLLNQLAIKGLHLKNIKPLVAGILQKPIYRVSREEIYRQLKTNKDGIKDKYVQENVKRSGWVLQYGSEGLRNDFNLVCDAVRQNGWALQFASEALRADRAVVLAAVRQDGWALQFASKELRADSDVVLAAVSKKGGALTYASLELKAVRDVVLAAVRQDGWALMSASKELRAYRNVVLAAVRQNGGAFQFASLELQADPEIRAAAGRL